MNLFSNSYEIVKMTRNWFRWSIDDFNMIIKVFNILIRAWRCSIKLWLWKINLLILYFKLGAIVFKCEKKRKEMGWGVGRWWRGDIYCLNIAPSNFFYHKIFPRILKSQSREVTHILAQVWSPSSSHIKWWKHLPNTTNKKENKKKKNRDQESPLSF